MREVDDSVVRISSTSSVLLNARLSIPLRPVDILVLPTVDDHRTATLRWAFFDMVNVASDRVDDNIREGYALILVSVRA